MRIDTYGIDELRDALRDFDQAALRMVSTAARWAAQVVAADARTRVPRRTGRLARTIRPSGRRGYALVRAGRGIPYEGPIHFGWNRHRDRARRIRGGPISAQPFLTDALAARRAEAVATFERSLQELLDRRFGT